MKIQNMGIIFVIIILPIVLILSVYIRLQINTITLQTSYDNMLTDSVYDAIKAYQINTANNPVGAISGSQQRDVEASINTLMGSLANRLGYGGYKQDYINPYIPAILFTLNDGYYIYTPIYNVDNNKYEHVLKPYMNYSVRYTKGTTVDIVVLYSLDNYITITGIVDNVYINESGYLINDNLNNLEEDLKEGLYITTEDRVIEYPYIFYNGENKYYDEEEGKWFLYKNGVRTYTTLTYNIKDTNAKEYDTGSKDFTKWIQDNLGSLTIGDSEVFKNAEEKTKYELYGNGSERIFDKSVNDFEDPMSNFEIHKRDIIKANIEKNLSTSIAAYNAHSAAMGTTYNFKMPKLSANEWDQITKDIAVVAFMQGLPIGFKIYNGYAVINNTRSRTFVNSNTVYFINENLPDGRVSNYHLIDCLELEDIYPIKGYKKVDFEATSVETTMSDPNRGTVQMMKYFYKHINLPCYYCIVTKNYNGPKSIALGINGRAETLTTERKAALNTVLGRERKIINYQVTAQTI